MWLLDANLDIHLVELLRDLGVECESAQDRGWKALKNGELVAAAANAGFTTLVTRDRLFAESAARAWRTWPDLAVVLVTLPQAKSDRYLESFRAAWMIAHIRPVPGRIVVWP